MRLKKLTNTVLSIFLATSLFTGFMPVVQAQENGEAVETESSAHLPDYREMYGIESKADQAQVKLNPRTRSTSPQKVAYIAVFIEFPDLPDIHLDHDDTVKAADMVFNSGGIIKPIGAYEIPIKPLKDYMKKYSYGKLEVTGSVFPKNEDGTVVSYMDKNPRSYYKKKTPNNPNGYSNINEQKKREQELIEGAMLAIKPSVERTLTPEQIDSGGDNVIDAISFFAEAPTDDNVGWGELLWSHKSTVYSSTLIHGKSINDYNMILTNDPKGIGSPFSYKGEGDNLKLERADYGTIHHEYFHTLGLPDLYRSNASGRPVGLYDIMADLQGTNPQGITAVMQRDTLKWGSPIEEVAKSKTVTLQRPKYMDGTEKTAVKILSPMNKNEYFVAEYYEMQTTEGAITGRSDGIILSRFNEKVDNYTNINGTADGSNDYMYIFRPGETKLGNGKGTLKDAVMLPTVGNTYGKLDSTATWADQTLHFSNGSNSGIQIKITAVSTDTITLELTLPDIKGSGTKEDPYLIFEPSDFDLIRGSANADVFTYFKLNNDINFENKTFETISSLGGQLDGNNMKISNINVVNGSGIFDSVGFVNVGNKSEQAVIKDLIIENINVVKDDEDSYVGALAGSVSGIVQNTQIISGEVKVTQGSKNESPGVGGFAGDITDSAIIENCSTSANVSGGMRTGGFVGLYENAVIKNSFANGFVSSSEGKIGGFIGDTFVVNTNQYPENSAFDIKSTGQNFAQAGRNVTGVTGYLAQDKIELDLNGDNEKSIIVETKPQLSTLDAEITIDSSGVALFDNDTQKVHGVAVGKTDLYVHIKVGTNTMPLKIPVEVKDTTIARPIQSVELNKTSITLDEGVSETLVATINPSDTTDNKTLTWSTSDATVASVDGNGKITAKKAGEATITVTTSNGKLKTCTVKVVGETQKPITSVVLDKNKVELNVGSTDTLIATINPSDTTDAKTLTWKSSKVEVAKVDATGNITAIAPGTTTITVTTSNGLTATCEVTITSPIISVELNKNKLELNVGSSETLVATINPSDTTDAKTLIWKSSKEEVAKVDATGNITAITPGTTTITVTTSNGLTATCEVTIKSPITSVELNKNKLELNVGSTETLVATINPSDTTDNKTLTWSSSDAMVASVDGNGKITAKKAGEAKITVTTSNGKLKTCTVKVVGEIQKPITSVELSKNKLELNVGSKETLIATINPSDTTDAKTLTWKSSKEEVAKVDVTGNITAIAPGTTTITVTTSNGLTATCEVTIKRPITSVVLNKNKLELNVGSMETLIATINPSDTTDAKTLTWKSSKEEVATVDATGNITAIAPGTTIISVTTNNGISASCEVTIKSPIVSISLNKNTSILNVGATDFLIATINPLNTTDDRTLTWSSSDATIASVDARGTVLARNVGIVDITVTSTNGKSATCTFNITKVAIAISTNMEQVDLTTGNSTSLTASLLPLDTTDIATWSWTSKDSSIATVDGNGVVKGVKDGETSIIVTASLKTGRVLSKEIAVKITDTPYQALNNLHNTAFTFLQNHESIKDAPDSFISNLNQKIALAKATLDKGEAALTKEEIEHATAELSAAMSAFDKVEYLVKMKFMMDIDLTLYDEDFMQSFLDVKKKVQIILEDPFTNLDKIELIFLKFQEEQKTLVMLDVSDLQNAIEIGDQLNLSNYIDGPEKESFLSSLAKAKIAKTAKTNREYAEAKTSLEAAQAKLLNLEKASNDQLKKMNEILAELERKLSTFKFEETYKILLDETIAKAKQAISNTKLTKLQATDMIAALEYANNLPFIEEETSLPEEEKKQEEIADVPTGDNHNVFLYIVGLLGGAFVLVNLKKKSVK